jgi:hypothetical protein
MRRLNDGLALFDAVIIIPMFQIVWTFFSIFTGFVYFAEYQVCFSTMSSLLEPSKVVNATKHILNRPEFSLGF